MNALAGLAERLFLQVREDVHAGRIEPDEERIVRLGLTADENLGRTEELSVPRFHALGIQRTRVLDLAVGGRLDHTARPELFLEFGVLRIKIALRLFLGV